MLPCRPVGHGLVIGSGVIGVVAARDLGIVGWRDTRVDRADVGAACARRDAGLA
jgi:glycine/D-amino acid oxidase-like deaminating enzyme